MKLGYDDIPKRKNVSVLVNRINNGAFQLEDAKSETYLSTGRVKETINGSEIIFKKNEYKESELLAFLTAKKKFKTKAKLEIEINKDGRKIFVNLTQIFKDKEFGGTSTPTKTGGKDASERQERGVIEAFRDAIKKNGYAKVDNIKGNIIYAEKKPGLSSINKEPYIDVVIRTDDDKEYGASLKGTSAPTLAGGGLAGITLIVPDLITNTYDRVQKYMKSELNLSHGAVVNAELVPNIYVKIPNEDLMKILKGTEEMGGPVTHMYIGPMDVSYKISKDKTITFNNGQGQFYTLQQYKKKVKNFYFRLRKRDIHSSGKTQIEYKAKNTEGQTMLLRQPNNGKNNVRLVVVSEDDLPSSERSNRVILEM